MTRVKLVYPAFKSGSPPRRTATALARETKTLWVVSQKDVVYDDSLGPDSSPRFGHKEVKFRKQTGCPVGKSSPFYTTWICHGPVNQTKES